MIIENCFYDKPKLLNCVKSEFKDKTFLPFEGQFNGYEDPNSYERKYKYEYKFEIRHLNVEYCIRQLVHHCIVKYALKHSKQKQFDTKVCKRNDLRELILFSNLSTDYDIRSLKYVDDMVDLVNTILDIM